jgi:hypothetical protein
VYRKLALIAALLAPGLAWGQSYPNPSFKATGATTPRAIGDRWAEVINVMDYGAKCDNATDDAAAINAALNQVRAIVAISARAGVTLALPQSIPGTFRRCIIGSTLNFTGLIGGSPNGVIYEGHGTTLYSTVSGAPIIDALGSNHIQWHDLKVQSAANATYGLQFGRTIGTSTDYGGGAGMRFDDLQVEGIFTIAGVYNFASEEVVFINPRIANSYAAAGAYGLIQDGYNHFNITSAFVTQTAPVDSPQSFEENIFIGGSIAAVGAGSSGPVWIGLAQQHRFIDTYFLGISGGVCATLYNEAPGIYLGIKGLDLDIHCEPGAYTTKLLITGTLASPTIRDLTLREVHEFSTGTIFALGGSVTSATLEHPVINISGGPTSPVWTLFDTANKYFMTGAEIYLYNATPWASSGDGPNNFSGRVVLPGAGRTQTYSGLDCAASSISPATNNARDWQSAMACTTILAGEVSTASALRLTTDSAAANSSNCVNLTVPLGSLATARVSIVARSRVTATNYVAWADWPIIYGNTSGAALNTFVTAGTKPTPVSGGTVTGTDVAITADTTNACLNVTWTPPTGNAELWDAVASVTFTQVR